MLNDMLQNQRHFIAESYVLVCYDYGPWMEIVWFIQGNVLPQRDQGTKQLKYRLSQFCVSFRVPQYG